MPPRSADAILKQLDKDKSMSPREFNGLMELFFRAQDRERMERYVETHLRTEEGEADA